MTDGTRCFTSNTVQMVTISIQVKEYLARYLYSTCRTALDGRAVHFSHNENLYHVLLKFTQKRPANVSWKEEGNLTLVIPKPEYGKPPEVYNYLSAEGCAKFEDAIERLLMVELYEFILKGKQKKGITYKDSAIAFSELHKLVGIEPESLLKKFERQRLLEKKYMRSQHL